MLRAAVERQCEIIGEALARLAKIYEPTASRISEHRRIIAFRNILIHGYAEVDHRLVWDVVTTKVPVLSTEVSGLLAEDWPDSGTGQRVIARPSAGLGAPAFATAGTDSSVVT
jgi:uncharacterized protein with HEPN domain